MRQKPLGETGPRGGGAAGQQKTRRVLHQLFQRDISPLGQAIGLGGVGEARPGQHLVRQGAGPGGEAVRLEDQGAGPHGARRGLGLFEGEANAQDQGFSPFGMARQGGDAPDVGEARLDGGRNSEKFHPRSQFRQGLMGGEG